MKNRKLVGNGLTWSNPKNKFLPKNLLYFSEKIIFSKTKVFHTRLKETITWFTHLAHSKKRHFYLKNFLYLPEKNNFSRFKKKLLVLSQKSQYLEINFTSVV